MERAGISESQTEDLGMAGRDVNININGKDNFSQAANAAGRSATNLKSTLNSVSSIGGLPAIFSAAGIGALAVGSVKLAAGYEQTNVAFKTMLKSGTAAKDLLAGISKFAAETPFQFTELTDAGKKLLAFGVAANDIVPTLRRIGDISSGIGAPIGEIAELYGKARVQGRLFAEDINQLTGRGIPIIQELAKQFGVADSEVRKLVESGQIGFKNLEQAFVSMTTGGGQFTGMMVEQSKTLVGQWSSLKDLIEQTGRSLGEKFLPELKQAVEMMAALIGGDVGGPVGRAVPMGERLPGKLGELGAWAERSAEIVEERRTKSEGLRSGIKSDEEKAAMWSRMKRWEAPENFRKFTESAAAKREQLRDNEMWLNFAEQDAAKAQNAFQAKRKEWGDVDAKRVEQQARGFNSATPLAQRGLALLSRFPGLAGNAFDAVSGGVGVGATGIMGAVQRQRMDELRQQIEDEKNKDPKKRRRLQEQFAMARTEAFESRFRVNAPGNNDAENKANADRLNREKAEAEKAEKQRQTQINLLNKMLKTGVILKKSNMR